MCRSISTQQRDNFLALNGQILIQQTESTRNWGQRGSTFFELEKKLVHSESCVISILFHCELNFKLGSEAPTIRAKTTTGPRQDQGSEEKNAPLQNSVFGWHFGWPQYWQVKKIQDSYSFQSMYWNIYAHKKTDPKVIDAIDPIVAKQFKVFVSFMFENTCFLQFVA